MCPFCESDAATRPCACATCGATFQICNNCYADWQPCTTCGGPHCLAHMDRVHACTRCAGGQQSTPSAPPQMKRQRTSEEPRPSGLPSTPSASFVPLAPFEFGPPVPMSSPLPESSPVPMSQPMSSPPALLHRFSARPQPPLKLSAFTDEQNEAPYIKPIVRLPPPPAQHAWMKLGDLAPCQHLFIAYDRDVNHSAVFEVIEACAALGLAVQPPRDPAARFQELSQASKFLQLVAARAPVPDFIFLQDQFITGAEVLLGAERSKPRLLVCLRKQQGPLATWAQQQLPSLPLEERPLIDTRLLQGAGSDQNSVEYGGNFLLSPPVGDPSDELPAGPAGPKVPAHPRAPWGKLIVGDARHPEKQGGAPERGIDGHSLCRETRRALCERTLQPVVPIDTSWLRVAHVDEILSFAPGARGPCLSIASPALMLDLLELLAALWPAHGSLTCFHAGQLGDGFVEHEQTPADLLRKKAYNLELQQHALDPILDRLRRTTGVADVVALPVLFTGDTPDRTLHQCKAHALTVDVVNMIVLPQGVIVPRPHGPRLPYDVAAKVVTQLLRRAPKLDPRARPLVHWPDPAASLRRVAICFTTCPADAYGTRPRSLEVEKQSPWLGDRDVLALAEQIAKASSLSPDSLDEPLGLCRLVIPLPQVDVVEWLIAELYDERGIRCTFADDWAYHVNGGDLHCGTNSIRRPPEDWPVASPRDLLSCLYDETTAAPPQPQVPAGPVRPKNLQKVVASYQGKDVPGKALMNRNPSVAGNIVVRPDDGTDPFEVPLSDLRIVA